MAAALAAAPTVPQSIPKLHLMSISTGSCPPPPPACLLSCDAPPIPLLPSGTLAEAAAEEEARRFAGALNGAIAGLDLAPRTHRPAPVVWDDDEVRDALSPGAIAPLHCHLNHPCCCLLP